MCMFLLYACAHLNVCLFMRYVLTYVAQCIVVCAPVSMQTYNNFLKIIRVCSSACIYYISPPTYAPVHLHVCEYRDACQPKS